MSEIDRITEIKDRAGTGAPNFTFGVNFAGSDSGINPHTHTESANEPSSPNNGDTWWDSDNNIYKVYMDSAWKDWLGTSSPAAHNNARTFVAAGVAASGGSYAQVNQIQYFSTASAGNASDFGDTLSVLYRAGALSDGAGGRGLIFGGGWSPVTNQIQYITVANTGNATDFGDLTNGSRTILGGCSDGTIGVMLAGNAGGSGSTQSDARVMDRVTVQTAANSTDHGNLVSDTFSSWSSTSCAGTARGLHVSTTTPSGGSAYSQIEYFDITTASNAANFGTLSTGNYGAAGVSDATRSVFGGNSGSGDNLEYVTPATLGNSTSFGDLTSNRNYIGGSDNLTYGFFPGGELSTGAKSDVIDHITIQTAANATDWGDLATGVEAPATSAA